MSIDILNKLKSGVTKVLESEPIAKAKEVVQEALPAKPAEVFQEAKAKLTSITGKAKAYVPSQVRDDLKGLVDKARSLSNAGGSSRFTASIVSAPVAEPKKVEDLKKAIESDDDEKIRDAINYNPSAVNDLTADQKAKALKRLEEGVVSQGDAHAMKVIVNSCSTKEELREVVGKATGNSPPTQSDFNKFDKQIKKHEGDAFLIADKLNPDNKELKTKAEVDTRAADAKAKARALDPSPSGSINREESWDPSKTAFVPKGPAEQKLEKDINVFVDEASVTARGSDADVKKLVEEAKTSAKGMDPSHGGDLLLRTADKLATAGHGGEARDLIQQLKQPPYSTTKVDLTGAYAGGTWQTKAANGNTVSVESGGINETLGAVADRRLAQLDQVGKMEKTLGRKVDPYNVNDLRDYFQKVKTTSGMKATGEEYNQFLKNFTKHPGGVENSWTQKRADLDDPTKMGEVMKQQTRDASGRMLLDCEGTTYLTGQIFGEKPKAQGTEVWITADKSHIAATVLDPKTGEGFHVNTMKSRTEYVSEVPKPLPKNEKDRQAVAWGFFAHNGKGGQPGMPDRSIDKSQWVLTKKIEQTAIN